MTASDFYFCGSKKVECYFSLLAFFPILIKFPVFQNNNSSNMKFSLLVIATSLAICSFAVTSPYYPAGWVDLYKPPYENLPTIVSSIQCLTSEFCMVSGMTNGQGVGVYKANGQYNGRWR